MVLYVFAVLIGVVAGLRAMTAPAAVSWAAHLGWIDAGDGWMSFMANSAAPWVFTILAAIELVTDKLPQTPSRKVPIQFATRIITGALCGATLCAASDALVAGAVAGAIGAIAGTLGGAELRARLAAGIGRDWPAALIEDAIAILGAIALVTLLP